MSYRCSALQNLLNDYNFDDKNIIFSDLLRILSILLICINDI